jgi:hypothetical protein
VEYLLAEYGFEACCRQLDWLPLRAAKNPSRFLVAAIEGNYDPPRGAKRQQLLEALPHQPENLPEIDFSVLDDLPMGDEEEGEISDPERTLAFDL